ncbi:50S ribosomal protein L24e [Candidatus Woesearchaeota archaeon]|nr:MAG: 50S ribosomal protein L24e [Candidatus Woesearchaeota archaeon ex4484_78]RLE46419.1 MAG: 50S ribosomal protein L24e [Candidatus Woesearchaeota archaeon]
MVKCTFCQKSIEPGKGTMFVKNDGKILHFCSSKCEKNMLKLKRTARELKWTKIYQKEKQKEKKETKK